MFLWFLWVALRKNYVWIKWICQLRSIKKYQETKETKKMESGEDCAWSSCWSLMGVACQIASSCLFRIFTSRLLLVIDYYRFVSILVTDNNRWIIFSVKSISNNRRIKSINCRWYQLISDINFYRLTMSGKNFLPVRSS